MVRPCLLILLFSIFLFPSITISQDQTPFPFSTDSTHITVWNGDHYSPLFIKGVNLGIGVPGTFPGELAATRDDYRRWFRLIRDAGFNTIRIYTLHFPHFYEELRQFNLQNPNHPIFFFHGAWLEEEVVGYTEDLFELSDLFDQEIRENVDAVHGNAIIAPRQGKAYGTFTADVSAWNIAYIIGREVHPPEVVHTNTLYPNITSYIGRYFSIENTQASEAWMVNRLDNLVAYENDTYGTQRPVSFSSWPSLDPLSHPFEENDYETMASLDISNLDFSRAKAGVFASYHAYPYYPDYISKDPKYQPFYDYLGQNSYLGYLTYLKEHYKRMPLIIAEFGAPSSWGVAHYAHSGIHHGGLDELTQGKESVRMLQNIDAAGGGGGILFAWLDEWFKRTWITDALDFDPERRIIWHNITAAEQNFGLLGYRKNDFGWTRFEDFCNDCPVRSLDVGADFSFLKLRVNMDRHLPILDTLWVVFDTYDADLGESILPNGKVVNNRAEFALMITNYTAELYVTEAYDTYGLWHNVSSPAQLYRSTATDGAPWNIVRWRNNTFDKEVQYIGQLRVNRLDLPQSSMDAVRLKDDHIEIRLPWLLLNFTDPSRAQVLHDDRSTPERETRFSDGINFGIFYKNQSLETANRYLWEPWNHALNTEEYKKDSYAVIKENFIFLPGNPVARTDRFTVSTGETTHIGASEGVLVNDLSVDGTAMIAVLEETTQNGLINLRPDGSFSYRPNDGWTGEDRFTYRVRAGAHWSDAVTVTLNVDGTPTGGGFTGVYPNPSSGQITVVSEAVIDYIEVFNLMGNRILRSDVNAKSTQITLQHITPGLYFVRIFSGRQERVEKVTIIY